MELTKVTTAALVEELKKREAVETHIAEPYADLEVKVNGPAIVFVITD
ncbi:MAG: BC1881 family protein [Oscillospiraceae bacterium]